MARLRQARIPPPSSIAVHNVMAANRGRDTGPERRLRSAIRRMGLKSFRVNYRIGRTRADIAFPSRRVAVFVHGCFWHHCPVCDLPMPKAHALYWRAKFERNRERDRFVRASLESEGWRVVELWEHEVRDDAMSVAQRIRHVVGREPQN